MQHFERRSFQETYHSRNLGSRSVCWTLFEPDVSIADDVNLIVPGVMAKRHLYRPYARESAERGLTIATMAHSNASPLFTKEIKEVAKELTDVHQKPVRLIGHSLGGMNATLAAYEQPEDISGLLLMQPAGYGGVNPTQAFSGFRERPNNSQLSNELKALFDGLDYLVSSRPDRLALTLFKATHKQVIEEAQSLPEHISRDALIFPDDVLIRPQKLEDGLSRAGFTWYDMDQSVHTGHNAVMYRAAAVADATVKIITMGDYQAA